MKCQQTYKNNAGYKRDLKKLVTKCVRWMHFLHSRGRNNQSVATRGRHEIQRPSTFFNVSENFSNSQKKKLNSAPISNNESVNEWNIQYFTLRKSVLYEKKFSTYNWDQIKKLALVCFLFYFFQSQNILPPKRGQKKNWRFKQRWMFFFVATL